ncbi:MAG: hypothetical protein AAGK78_03945, partial [Planctomycetota bacterium]
MPTRRHVVTAGLASAAATLTAAKADAQDASTQPGEDLIGPAGQLIGRAYTDEEKQLMHSGVERFRGAVKLLRAAKMPPTLETATVFDPVVPGHELPAGEIVYPELDEAPTYDGNVKSLAFASVADQAALLRAGKVTSVELTRMYLTRLKEHGPTLKCVITLTENLALQQAERADARDGVGHRAA